MLVLGIETSCDETAVAVVKDGRLAMSNVVASQVEVHARYGGVVPEIASRQHILQILPVVNQSLAQAKVTLEQIDLVAVTYGPGLAGSLLVGVNTAKALAFTRGIPFMGINHLEGHIYASWLQDDDPEVDPGFPLLCLLASGGHTDLILMEGHDRFQLLGRTRDDAAGESFDKAGRILGLGYPGGPAIQAAAEGVDTKEQLPRAWMRGTLEFSFSGLKTALLHKAQDYGLTGGSVQKKMSSQSIVNDLAAAFQTAVVDVLVAKTIEAARETGAKGILLGGGVAANTLLRQRMKADSKGLPVLVPVPALCVDNGAMIAACAYFRRQSHQDYGWDLDVVPSLRLG